MSAEYVDLDHVRAKQHHHALLTLSAWHIDAIKAGIDNHGFDLVEPGANVVKRHGALLHKAQRIGADVVDVVQVHSVHIAAHTAFWPHTVAGVDVEVDALLDAHIVGLLKAAAFSTSASSLKSLSRGLALRHTSATVRIACSDASGRAETLV